MANSKLQGKTYTLTDNVIDFLSQFKGTGEFEKRISGLLTTGTISYEQLKLFKHDLEQRNAKEWKPFLNWINTILDTERTNVEKHKEVTSDAGMSNRYRKERGIDLNRPTKETLMNETIKKVIREEILNLKK